MKVGEKSSPPAGGRSAGVNRGAPGGKSWGTATTAGAPGTPWRAAGEATGGAPAAPAERDRWTWPESDRQRERGDGWLNTSGAPSGRDGDERRRD